VACTGDVAGTISAGEVAVTIGGGVAALPYDALALTASVFAEVATEVDVAIDLHVGVRYW